MQTADAQVVRAAVRKTYGEIASGSVSTGYCNSTGCCGPAEPTSSRDIGYSEAELGNVPDGADLGLGCGNPQAIASLKPGERVLDLGSGGPERRLHRPGRESPREYRQYATDQQGLPAGQGSGPCRDEGPVAGQVEARPIGCSVERHRQRPAGATVRPTSSLPCTTHHRAHLRTGGSRGHEATNELLPSGHGLPRITRCGNRRAMIGQDLDFDIGRRPGALSGELSGDQGLRTGP